MMLVIDEHQKSEKGKKSEYFRRQDGAIQT